MSIADCNKPVAENIAAIIEKKGLKQISVAKKAGYTAQELSYMLNGRKIIKVCDILKIAQALGVGIDELYANE